MAANLTSAQLAGYRSAGGSAWVDPATGLVLMPLNSAGADPWIVKFAYGDENPIAVGMYSPGGPYDVYTSAGVDTGKDGNYSDGDSFLKDLVLAAAIMGGVFLAGSALAGAGAAGPTATTAAPTSFGVAGDAYLPAATMGDAYLPGALQIGGTVGEALPLAGFDSYLVSGATAGAGAAAGASAAGSGTTAGVTSTITGALNTVGSIASKAIGLATSALGLSQAAGGGSSGGGAPAPAGVSVAPEPALLSGVSSNTLLLAVAIVGGALALSAMLKKKG